METNNKCREALEGIVHGIEEKYAATPTHVTPHEHAILRICKAALAAPPRNCDVGTAEEQEARFVAFCDGCNASTCDHRMFAEEVKAGCALAWAQMPYTEGGAK